MLHFTGAAHTWTMLLLLAARAESRLGESPWERVDFAPLLTAESVEPWNRFQLRDEADAVWIAGEEGLTRVWSKERTLLAPTDTTGPGRAYDLAIDGQGRLFVAAENGLYVAARNCDSLDPIPLDSEGVPARATSIHLDDERRIWVATEGSLHVLDPAHFQGREFDLAGHPPGEPPYRITGDGQRVFVQSSAGVFQYRPPERPVLDGTPWRFADEPTTGPVRVEPRARAAGGATFQYRLDGHHVWKPVEPGQVLGTAPGEHVLELIALDRTMQRSDPLRIAFRTPRPLYARPGFLLAALSASIAALFALARAYLRETRRALLSTAIAVPLILQVVAACVPHAKAWPFVGYSMYTRAAEPGGLTLEAGIAALRGKRWRRLKGAQAGIAVDSRWQLLQPLIEGGAPAARDYIERVNALRPGREIDGIQVRVWRRRLTADGPVEVAPLILLDYRLPEPSRGDDREERDE